MKIMGAFALLAALGNALFVIGQKKAADTSSPFLMIALSSFLCAVPAFLVSLFFKDKNMVLASRVILNNGFLCGAGLFITYTGFFFLFTRYGASSFTLYAALSILTTSIGVGVLYFKEAMNIYHWFALTCALISVLFFSLGQNRL